LLAVITYPLFSGPRYLMVSFKFLACRPVAMATNFGTKLTITRLPQKKSSC